MTANPMVRRVRASAAVLSLVAALSTAFALFLASPALAIDIEERCDTTSLAGGASGTSVGVCGSADNDVHRAIVGITFEDGDRALDFSSCTAELYIRDNNQDDFYRQTFDCLGAARAGTDFFAEVGGPVDPGRVCRVGTDVYVNADVRYTNAGSSGQASPSVTFDIC